MSPNEFAFLALGLGLGMAVGAALVIVARSRPPTREVRLTVEHAAVPRRSTTLSADAFQASAGEVARGGPADRRAVDRDDPAHGDPPGREPGSGSQAWPAGPVAPPAWIRTTVRYGSPVPVSSGAAQSAAPGPSADGGIPARPVGIPIRPEPDPDLAALRAQVAVAADRAARGGHLTATALLERRPAVAVATAPEPAANPEAPPDGTPAIVGLLRGHHPTLVAATRTIGGEDAGERRRWGAMLILLADGLRDAAIRAGALELPGANPFWDLFTPEQARDVVAALAAAGHRFDGRGGWADDRIPLHRDLTIAVAAAGMEPGRIRQWPDADAIRSLLRGARVAADAFVAERAPDLELEAIQEVLGVRATTLSSLWSDWERARTVLVGPVEGPARASAG